MKPFKHSATGKLTIKTLKDSELDQLDDKSKEKGNKYAKTKKDQSRKED